MKNTIYFSFLLILFSCVPEAHPDVSNETYAKLNNFKGKHKREVVLEYGNPEKKEPFEGGAGEIWSYFFDLNRGPIITSSGTVPPHSSTVRLMFFIESDTVYQWKTRRQEHQTNSTIIY